MVSKVFEPLKFDCKLRSRRFWLSRLPTMPDALRLKTQGLLLLTVPGRYFCCGSRMSHVAMSVYVVSSNMVTWIPAVHSVSCPRGYKTFFMHNSVEHEILNAHKYKNIKKFVFFLGSDKPRILFFPLINVRMPTIVGISTFMSRKNFMSWAWKKFYNLGACFVLFCNLK